MECAHGSFGISRYGRNHKLFLILWHKFIVRFSLGSLVLKPSLIHSLISAQPLVISFSTNSEPSTHRSHGFVACKPAINHKKPVFGMHQSYTRFIFESF